MKLVPGAPGVSTRDIHPDHAPIDAGESDLPTTCDGKIYTYHLGPPIVSCTIEQLNDPTLVTKFQDRIRQILKTERLNTIYRALGLPYWTWVLQVDTNNSHKLAFAYDDDRTITDRDALLAEIVPFICALGLAYLKENKYAELGELKGIAGQLPRERVPEEVRKALTVLFG